MELNRLIDHTLLRANAREDEIRQLCKEARDHEFYSVCINPRWVKFCAGELMASKTVAISVVGFPLGASLKSSKEKECEHVLREGAQEVDMVIDLANVFGRRWKDVESEIKALAVLCERRPLKVIIETAYLSDDEIIECTKCCLFGGAAFVKTSTGFAPSGAKEEHIRLIKAHAGPMGIKASGGIKTFADAERLIRAGATRIGASASVAMMSEWKASQ